MLLQSDVFVKNFLKLPERTRLFRLFKTIETGRIVFWRSYRVGIVDNYSVELLHPCLKLGMSA